MTARYCKGTFTSTYKKTIGVDYLEKTLDMDAGETVKMMVWDTAGQEEYDALTSTYYRGACARGEAGGGGWGVGGRRAGV